MPTTYAPPVGHGCFRWSSPCTTVGELIQHLEQLPADMPLLVSGDEKAHFRVIRLVKDRRLVPTCQIDGDPGYDVEG